jgi:ribosome maturation factor RimP
VERVGFRPTFLLTVQPDERIATLIEPTLDDMGYQLVRVLISGSRSPTLQVMAERSDLEPMTVDDCAAISRAISVVLDVENPIPSAYRLEVSSPGIDRPLVRPIDFERFAGFDARIETEVAIEGRKRFQGRLLGVVEDRVRLHLADGDRELPLASIRKAKLVVTDELLRAAQAERRS